MAAFCSAVLAEMLLQNPDIFANLINTDGCSGNQSVGAVKYAGVNVQLGGNILGHELLCQKDCIVPEGVNLACRGIDRRHTVEIVLQRFHIDVRFFDAAQIIAPELLGAFG